MDEERRSTIVPWLLNGTESEWLWMVVMIVSVLEAVTGPGGTKIPFSDGKC
jgi:hypothetical protein